MKIENNTSTSEVLVSLTNNIDKMIDARSRIMAYTKNDRKIFGKDEASLLKIYRSIGVLKKSLKQNEKELLENPYYQNIRLEDISYKDISYSNLLFKARCGINMDYVRFHGAHLESHIDIGYFDVPVNIPVLKEKGKIWMSPTIAEQRSMQRDINRARGNVLTFGLGIGYYAYMCLIKEEVESVTVVEFNPDVIALFKEYILPQFPEGKRIEIIEGDMYDYYNESFLSKFDYIFVDVWEDNESGLTHYKKLMATGIRKENIGYWIEESITEPIKMLMLVYFKNIAAGTYMRKLQEMNGDTAEEFKMIHRYFRKKDEIVTRGEQLLYYINSVNTIRDITAL